VSAAWGAAAHLQWGRALLQPAMLSFKRAACDTPQLQPTDGRSAGASGRRSLFG